MNLFLLWSAWAFLRQSYEYSTETEKLMISTIVFDGRYIIIIFLQSSFFWHCLRSGQQ